MSTSTDVMLIARRAYRELSGIPLTHQARKIRPLLHRGGMAVLRRAYRLTVRIPVVGGAARMLVARLRHQEQPHSWYRDPRTEVVLAGLVRLNSEMTNLKVRIELLENDRRS